MIALSKEPVRRPADNERQVIGWGSSGRIYADDMAERSRVSTVRLALEEIADAQGDVDAFIAQHDEPTRKVPKIAAEIARRLLAAGRTKEAYDAVLSSFSGRQQLYERYFAGDLVRAAGSLYHAFDKEPHVKRIAELLDRFEREADLKEGTAGLQTDSLPTHPRDAVILHKRAMCGCANRPVL